MATLIVGCGYVGGRLLGILKREGRPVWGMRRSPERLEDPHMLQADVTDPTSLRTLPANVTELVYAVSPERRDDESYRRAYPLGLGHMMEKYPHARVIFVSSTAVYGQAEGAVIDDQCPAAATHFRATRLREAEELARRSGKHHVVFRASGIYGPDRTRLLSTLVHHDLGESEKQVWTNRIHVDDLAQCIRWALDSDQRSGTYIASDAEPARLGDVQRFVRSLPGARDKLEYRERTGGRGGRQSRKLLASRLGEEHFAYRFPSYREGYAALIEAL